MVIPRILEDKAALEKRFNFYKFSIWNTDASSGDAFRKLRVRRERLEGNKLRNWAHDQRYKTNK